MLRTSLSRPLRHLSTHSTWRRNVQYRLAHNVSTAQQQTTQVTTDGDKDVTASVTTAGPSSSVGSTSGSSSDSLLAAGEKQESDVSDSSSSRSIPLSSPSSFPSEGTPEELSGHSTSTLTSQTKKDPTSTDASADVLSTLPTYNLDEVKQRIRHWTEHAAVTIRERADEFTAKTKTQFSQLGAHLNKVTGYEEIEALKRDVVAQEQRINETRRSARQAKLAYEESVIQRSKSQREVNDLLQRKSTWTDNDVSRFTTLVRQDHLYEQEEQRAKTAVDDTEEAVEKEFSQLMRLILARYHEEQVWSDKIRSASTYGQLAALGLNMLVFILAIILVEPWKRKRLAQTFERKVEELSEDYARLLEGSMNNIDQRLVGQERLLVELAEDLARRESSSSAWSDVVVAERASGVGQVPLEQTATPSIPLPPAGGEEVVVQELPKTARITVANVELSSRTVEMLAIGTGTFVLGALTANINHSDETRAGTSGRSRENPNLIHPLKSADPGTRGGGACCLLLMTSFIIDAHLDRSLPDKWQKDPECVFCRIIDRELPASILFETEKVIAILDILPLRKGHALVIPKTHVARLSELPAEYAAATGEAVSKVANALTQALDHTGLNVVCNQEYAQMVPHVHYHIIPAPRLDSSPASEPSSSSNSTSTTAQGKSTGLSHHDMHQIERQGREELDDDDAEELTVKVKAHL